MRKKCKRVVRPLVNPIAMAVEGASVSDKSALDKLRLRELAAIEAMAKGVGTKQEWQDLADMCNLCESMARAHIGIEAIESTEAAQKALIDVHARMAKTGGRMVLKAAELQALRDVFEYHDLQRSSVARSVYEAHIVKVTNKIKTGRKDVLVVG